MKISKTVFLIFVNIVFCFHSAFSAPDYANDALKSHAVEKGKLQYDLLQAKAKIPRYGDCWRSALGQVEAGCKRLNEDQQARLSLALVACQMDQLGIKRKPMKDSDESSSSRTYHCDPDTPVHVCTSGIDQDVNAFTAFSQFFTHTAHMCFFLESQRWHEATALTVDALLRSSEVVARGLNISTQIQERLITSQEELLARGVDLSQSLESSSEGVQRLFDEFRSSTENQRLLVVDTISRVAQLQSFVVDQVSLFYAYIFYIAGLVVASLLTSTKRSGGARVWLFALLTLNLIVERSIVYFIDRHFAEDYGVNEIGDMINIWAWRCRHSFLSLAATVLLWKIWAFQDLHVINNAVLQQIHKQNADLKQRLEALASASRPPSTLGPNKNDDDGTDSLFAERSLTESYANSFLPSEMDSSLDITFVPRKNFSDDDDDTESYITGSSSGRSSRTELIPLGEKPSVYPRTTSMTSMGSSLASSASAVASSMGSTLSSLVDELKSLSPPGLSGLNIGKETRYNLRPRSQCSRPASSVGDALRRGVEIIREETPEEFGVAVRQMLNVSRRNAKKVKKTLRTSGIRQNRNLRPGDQIGVGFFSSDDE